MAEHKSSLEIWDAYNQLWQTYYRFTQCAEGVSTHQPIRRWMIVRLGLRRPQSKLGKYQF
jgi:hypothetical protein